MKALLIVDVENDFTPGGALAVPDGDKVVPIINKILKHFTIIVASKDWHPPGHVSFASSHPGKKIGDVIIVDGINQVLWPDHCIRGSRGSAFVPELNKEPIISIFYKGTDQRIDGYSAFFDNAHLQTTGLADFLQSRKVTDLYIAGLATDYCVLYSTMDALQLGFKVFIISDACRAINLNPNDERDAYEKMKPNGAKIITSKEIKISV